MDANEFYTRKEDLLERLSNAVAELQESMSQLMALERKAVEPDLIVIEELESLQGYACDMDEWTDIEWTAVHPLAEAARVAAKK